jgi:hypothetical protein
MLNFSFLKRVPVSTGLSFFERFFKKVFRVSGVDRVPLFDRFLQFDTEFNGTFLADTFLPFDTESGF